MRKKSKGDTWDGIFADPEVGRVLYANGLIADANKSSIKELATITSLNPSGSYDGSYFYDNTVITKFPELQYCTGLTNMYGAFYGCSNLIEVGNIPESVTNMEYTFTNCSSLVKAPIIPEGVTEMYYIFRNCTKLDGIFIIKPVTPPRIYRAFEKVKIVGIYVPDESVSSYKRAPNMSNYSSYVKPMSELPE